MKNVRDTKKFDVENVDLFVKVFDFEIEIKKIEMRKVEFSSFYNKKQ